MGCNQGSVASVIAALTLTLNVNVNLFFVLPLTDDPRRVSVRDLFAALQEPEIDRLQQLAASVQSFNRRESLKRTETCDRSAPYIDHHVAHLLAIHNYKHDELHHVTTRVTQHVVVGDNTSTHVTKHVVVGDNTSSVCDTEGRSNGEAINRPKDETGSATNKPEHSRDR